MSTQTRILVVDDDDRVLFVLHDTLTLMGDEYEVVVARNGLDALGQVKADSFSLVITDLRMPGMDGVALTEAIRELAPDIAVIWMTAYGCYRMCDDVERLTVYRCLDKPLRIGKIRGVVREALENVRAERADQAVA
ncbi:MAG: response regulator [Chloroflexi bacterium]|nr:response regulator [Chloroflexota bacterium]MBU1750673.1 response regulator [Chloroflexota bacterium]